jgi:hypothetical protein
MNKFRNFAVGSGTLGSPSLNPFISQLINRLFHSSYKNDTPCTANLTWNVLMKSPIGAISSEGSGNNPKKPRLYSDSPSGREKEGLSCPFMSLHTLLKHYNMLQT